MEVVRRVPTYFRTRQHLGSCILYLAGRVESAGEDTAVDGNDRSRHPGRSVGEQE